MKRTRLIYFLAASFVSAMGDALIIFAVPIGLGVQTNDLSTTAFIWFLPAVSVFAATFLHSHVARRKKTARKNYATIVICVAALELVIAAVALQPFAQSKITLLIALFILGYAFIKEGIPRLLYVVSVYNYFGDPDEYSSIAGLSASLNILAALLGTLLASFLIAKSDWKFAMLFDALSFVILGCVLLFVGKDPAEDSDSAGSELTKCFDEVKHAQIFKWIVMAMAIVPIVDCLVFNYVPLLGARYALFNVSAGITSIGFLRLPGMIAGLLLRKIVKIISAEKLIIALPLSLLVFAVLFIVLPSLISFGALVVIQGVMTGVYWPTDYSFRNQLSHHKLVSFNTFALRWLVAFQALSCIAALVLFRIGADLRIWTPVCLGSFSALSAILIFGSRLKRKFLEA